MDAKWIWIENKVEKPYNQTVVFRKDFELPSAVRAIMKITADSLYRLKINEDWLNDGPCRSYPAHYQYDEFDVTSSLREGGNTIEVVAKFFGCGTFHQQPQIPGFWSELSIETVENGKITVVSDETWNVALAKAWLTNVPKSCPQMEALEVYDANHSDTVFTQAVEVLKGKEKPWRDLSPRDCKLLTKYPVSFQRFAGAEIVDNKCHAFAVPVMRLCYPGLIDANCNVSRASGVAMILRNKGEARKIAAVSRFYSFTANGAKADEEGKLMISEGDNLLLGMPMEPFYHVDDWDFRLIDMENVELINPLDEKEGYPCCFIRLPEFEMIESDVIGREAQVVHDLKERLKLHVTGLVESIDSLEKLKEIVGEQVELIPEDCQTVADIFPGNQIQKVLRKADELVECPENMLFGTPECSIIKPSNDGDVRLILDLGTQNCGYYDFEVYAAVGTTLDLYSVEYITASGDIQHTGEMYKNGMRYICKRGVNRFTSLKRRSGRYLLLTIRHQTGPVEIRHIHLIESTYPVEYKGDFRCDDLRLNEIWKISAHTLKLCMEDTFTDCPLYEQTLWVGDMRNEALLAYPVFGAWDLAKRCINITAQSLEQLPLAGCQVPSGWDIILPAWSFMWGMSIWEYYFETVDIDYLKKVWPAALKNLQAAQERIEPETGLFSMLAWNMFDWSGTDYGHKTVVHNSMLLIGALDAAKKCAEVLNDQEAVEWVTQFRQSLCDAVNATWSEEKQAYPDSIKEDGTPTESCSIHTSFLALLYDIAPVERIDLLKRQILNPPEWMVQVGSPFAMFYYYETLEKIGACDVIINNIIRDYQPMLDTGSTTVWETFVGALNNEKSEFPTRSHCHAWSSAPTRFLSRVTLGLTASKVGAKAFVVSPFFRDGLNHAKGRRATVNGNVQVEWCREGNNVTIKASAPAGTALTYQPNASHDGLNVKFELS